MYYSLRQLSTASSTLKHHVEVHVRVASDKVSTDELWQWYLLVGAQHLSIGGTGCQGSKHTVVTMVADERTTSGLGIPTTTVLLYLTTAVPEHLLWSHPGESYNHCKITKTNSAKWFLEIRLSCN